MTIHTNKTARPPIASVSVVYLLFGTLILLCIQARISKAIPQEGPFQYLSSATKMIHNRALRLDHVEQIECDAVEPARQENDFTIVAAATLPLLLALTTPKCKASQRIYFLRPPPPVS